MPSTAAAPQTTALTVSKITWRLIPYLGFIYLIAYIDRQNVSYAKLQMVSDLGLSEYAYGRRPRAIRRREADRCLPNSG
jgi:hypothetical protein